MENKTNQKLSDNKQELDKNKKKMSGLKDKFDLKVKDALKKMQSNPAPPSDFDFNTKSVVEIRSFNLHYGEIHAVKDINMTINCNEITAMIGPSGCGKSTLLKSINRMNDLVEGCKIDGIIKVGNTEKGQNSACDYRKCKRR